MSMYRQLWLAILGSALLALMASLLVSLINARSYLEAQLAMKNQDNAAALALALSQGAGDRDQIILAATALFDGGHYQLIQVVGPQGQGIVNKVASHARAGAPDWFVALLPIRSLPGRAEISSGWQPLGSLTLMSSAEFAYQSLWETALTMVAVFLACALACGFLGGLILRRITDPMRAVIEQARAINDHRFIQIPVSGAPEVRELTRAMNDTVQRLRVEFEDQAQRTDSLRREANFDPLTGLPNRAHFLAALDSALAAEVSQFSVLALIRLRRLGKINRALGREAADQTLRGIAGNLSLIGRFCPGGVAGRLNGADFALLLSSSCEVQPTLEALLAELGAQLHDLGEEYAHLYIVHTALMPGDTTPHVLARLDSALALADQKGQSVVLEAATDPTFSYGGEEWRERLRDALASRDGLKLAHFPMRLGNGVQQESVLRLKHDGEWLCAGHFLPIADRLGLAPALDRVALKLALEDLKAQPDLPGVWLNLSAKSITDPEFLRALRQGLDAHPEERGRLWLEVPEAGGLARLSALRDLSRELTPLDCKLGLEHYGHHFDQINVLYELGLDFLKVDSSFIRGIDHNHGNRAFLTGLLEIAHRIDIKVLAEGVERQEELDTLLALGFDGACGPLLRDADHMPCNGSSPA